jgi:cysteine desulfuration protein SufE
MTLPDTSASAEATGQAMPEALAEIAADFTGMPVRERLQLLLEFSDNLPDLPQRYADRVELMEKVDECQSPVFLVVEVGDQRGERPGSQPGDQPGDQPRDQPKDQPKDQAGDQVVRLHFQAPAEAPTTRGFAGILSEGLSGLTVSEVLAVPDDAPYRFGLAEAVSPLRLRGMVAMLGRIKRQVRLKSAA